MSKKEKIKYGMLTFFFKKIPGKLQDKIYASTHSDPVNNFVNLPMELSPAVIFVA